MAMVGLNNVPVRSLYQRSSGLNLAQQGSSVTAPQTQNSPKSNKRPTEAAVAAQIGASGSPLLALGVIAVLLFALMFIAKRFGSEASEFASVKLSFYNIIVISLAAVIGINFFKLVFTKVKIPGVSAVFLAA